MQIYNIKRQKSFTMEFLKNELQEFLVYVQKNRSEATYKTYISTLKYAINDIEVDNQRIDIRFYRKKIAHQHKRTIAKKLSILRAFFNYLDDKGFNFRIVGDESVKIPKSYIKTISLYEIKKVLKEATPLQYIVVLTIFGLGLKIKELKQIKVSDIDSNSIKIVAQTGKIRVIPLEIHLQETIQKYIKRYLPQTYLFEKEGKQLTETQLRTIIKQAFKQVGLNITPKQLRYSFATLMLQNGAKIKDVSELLGYQFILNTQTFQKLNPSTKFKTYMKAHPLCST